MDTWAVLTNAAMNICMDTEELLVHTVTSLLFGEPPPHLHYCTSHQRVSNPCQLPFLSILYSQRVGVRCYLPVLSSCTFLVTNSTQRLPMCFLAICVSMKKCLLQSSAHFRLSSFLC